MMFTGETLTAASVRNFFPILEREINRSALIYFDNAASMQMPRPVLERLHRYATFEHANVHRGIHTLSYEATMMFEEVRELIRRKFDVPDSHEVLFTSGTTHAINLVAYGLRKILSGSDEILFTRMEHHANIVPWQMSAQATGAKIQAADVLENAALDRTDFDRKLNSRTKIVAVTAISNVTGVINPIASLVNAARSNGSITLVDGAQAVAHHFSVFSRCEPDFLAFSAHKIGGPTGTGVLIARKSLLEIMDPMLGGGDMIKTVNIEASTWAEIPHKFEAGTPNISGVIGLGAAVTFWDQFDPGDLRAQEDEIAHFLRSELKQMPEIRLIGFDSPQVSTVSFVVNGIHPHDVGTFLDQEGIAVRVGHHCAQPLMKRFSIPGTIRASISPYNTLAEAARFVEILQKTIRILKN